MAISSIRKSHLPRKRSQKNPRQCQKNLTRRLERRRKPRLRRKRRRKTKKGRKKKKSSMLKRRDVSKDNLRRIKD